MGNGKRRSSANELGRRLRKRLPRRQLAELVLPADRDPLGILEEQHASRLKDLVPVRVGRMLQSPFAFYRGTAALMAADLAAACRRVEAAGATCEGGIRSASWGRIATFADPFGHGFCLLEFVGRGYDEIASG